MRRRVLPLLLLSDMAPLGRSVTSVDSGGPRGHVAPRRRRWQASVRGMTVP
jgi:hypothetical protein